MYRSLDKKHFVFINYNKKKKKEMTFRFKNHILNYKKTKLIDLVGSINSVKNLQQYNPLYSVFFN